MQRLAMGHVRGIEVIAVTMSLKKSLFMRFFAQFLDYVLQKYL